MIINFYALIGFKRERESKVISTDVK